MHSILQFYAVNSVFVLCAIITMLQGSDGGISTSEVHELLT